MTKEEKPAAAPGLDQLEEALGYSFQDKAILELALTHSSYRNEKAEVDDDNERFEFLGDAILDLVVARWLFQNNPRAEEGELTEKKAVLVCEPSLARLAAEFDLGAYLRLGRGEEMSGGRSKRSLLANSMEAVVASVFLDGGYDQVTSVVLRWLSEADLSMSEHWEHHENPRSTLQNLVQARYGTLPEFEVEGESGDEGEEGFVARVLVPEQAQATGTGRSKKEAIRAAAAQMLDQINDSN